MKVCNGAVNCFNDLHPLAVAIAIQMYQLSFGTASVTVLCCHGAGIYYVLWQLFEHVHMLRNRQIVRHSILTMTAILSNWSE